MQNAARQNEVTALKSSVSRGPKPSSYATTKNSPIPNEPHSITAIRNRASGHAHSLPRFQIKIVRLAVTPRHSQMGNRQSA